MHAYIYIHTHTHKQNYKINQQTIEYLLPLVIFLFQLNKFLSHNQVLFNFNEDLNIFVLFNSSKFHFIKLITCAPFNNCCFLEISEAVEINILLKIVNI